jgi:hypothetical protein
LLKKCNGPAITEKSYEKQNRKMRSEYTKETGKKLGTRQTSGTGKRRVSFACRFGGMAGSLKNKKGEPTKLKMALKKWGFGSKEAARNFCNKNKEKK